MKFYYNQKNGSIYPFHRAYANIPHMQEIDAVTAAKILDERRRQAEEIGHARQLLIKQAVETGFTEASQQLAELAAQTPAPTETEKQMLEKVKEEQAEQMAEEAKRKAAPKPRKRKRKKKTETAEEATTAADQSPINSGADLGVEFGATTLEATPVPEAVTATAESILDVLTDEEGTGSV